MSRNPVWKIAILAGALVMFAGIAGADYPAIIRLSQLVQDAVDDDANIGYITWGRIKMAAEEYAGLRRGEKVAVDSQKSGKMLIDLALHPALHSAKHMIEDEDDERQFVIRLIKTIREFRFAYLNGRTIGGGKLLKSPKFNKILNAALDDDRGKLRMSDFYATEEELRIWREHCDETRRSDDIYTELEQVRRCLNMFNYKAVELFLERIVPLLSPKQDAEQLRVKYRSLLGSAGYTLRHQPEQPVDTRLKLDVNEDTLMKT